MPVGEGRGVRGARGPKRNAKAAKLLAVAVLQVYNERMLCTVGVVLVWPGCDQVVTL